MKNLVTIINIALICLLITSAGCEPASQSLSTPPAQEHDPPFEYNSYAAAKVRIMPITKCYPSTDDDETSNIRIFFSLYDAYDCQIKSPGIFRFELYEYVQFSREHKGKRIVIKPDINLTNDAVNNSYWRDFLRAYEMTLNFKSPASETYILQITCQCPNGKRLSSDYLLKPGK